MFITETRGSVLVLTMQRAPVNAINREWIDGFDAVLDDLERRPEVTVLLVRSSQRAFSAGADLKLMRECFATEDDPTPWSRLSAVSSGSMTGSRPHPRW